VSEPGARWAGVGLVAQREVAVRVRGRAFRIGTVLILVAVAAAIVIPTLVHSGRPQRVGLVGPPVAGLPATVAAAARSVGTTVEVSDQPSVDTAEQALRDGSLDVVVVDGGELVVATAISPTSTGTTAQLVRALSGALGVQEAFRAAGLTAAQRATLAQAGPAPVTSLAPAPNTSGRTTSVIGVVLVFVMLSQYNTWTLLGVMEEKSSRVVEVLLAAVRPAQLLTGKVLGIGVVAVGQAALIVAVALALARAVGSDLLRGAAPLEVVTALGWLLLGYAFYSWLYAAAGSMVERQDQVQTLAIPLSLPLLFGYITALSVAGGGNASLLVKVLAYVPLTAPFAVPVLVGLGAISWWQVAVAAGISLVATVGMARLAARVYRRAILRTGRRVSLREAVFSRGG